MSSVRFTHLVGMLELWNNGVMGFRKISSTMKFHKFMMLIYKAFKDEAVVGSTANP